MPYRLDREGAPGEGLRAVALEQIDGARAVLRDEQFPVAKRVHEARKYLKRIRALLRLLKGPLGHREKKAQRRLREAGRHLSDSRDATVIRGAFDEILAAGVNEADPTVLSAVAERLRANAERAEADGGGIETAIAKVEKILVKVRGAVIAWDLEGYSKQDLAKACAESYREARRGRRRVRKKTGAARAHEWRKRLKEHLYHMQLLDNPRADALDAIAELLGRANDLAVLGEHLHGGDGRDSALELAVEKARRHAIKEARAQGRQLFRSKPSAFGASLLGSL